METNIKLPRSRRREGVCQVLRNTFFFIKNRKKTLFLRQIEVRIKFKKAKLLGETGKSVGEYMETPRKISEKCKEELFSSCKKHIFILQTFIDRNKPMDCNLCYVFRPKISARDDMINGQETSHFPSPTKGFF